MPKNDVFMFNVLLGSEPVREYEKVGQTYIMTNLMHHTTYREERIEYVDGREEKQNIPVTPYEIAITLTSSKWQEAWAKVYVDGCFVRRVFLKQGQKFVVKGFDDGDKIREFLFSLPRFGRDKDDRIEKDRVNKVGCILVELYEASYSHTKMQSKRSRSEETLDYKQATKKDTCEVTKGKYTMATTKAGRCIDDKISVGKRKRSNGPERVTIWNTGMELSNLDIKYHMRHTLVEMGIDILE